MTIPQPDVESVVTFNCVVFVRMRGSMEGDMAGEFEVGRGEGAVERGGGVGAVGVGRQAKGHGKGVGWKVVIRNYLV